MNELANTLIYVTAAVVLLFVLGYGLFAPWWRSPMGRNVMAMSITHLMIFSLITANMIWGVSWVGRPLVRVVIYGSICSVFAWRGVILLKEQIFARARAKEAQDVR